MIGNLLFDMGGVLIRWEPRAFVMSIGTDPSDAELLLRAVYMHPDWSELDRGALTEEEVIRRAKERLPEHLHAMVEPLVSGWDELFTEQMPGMEELVDELAQAGFRLYLLSNAAKRHHQYWPKFPVSRYFEDRVFVSADYGLLKPDKAFFDTALSHFGLRAEECLFIDDKEANVRGAAGAGVSGIVFGGSAERLREELANRKLVLYKTPGKE